MVEWRGDFGFCGDEFRNDFLKVYLSSSPQKPKSPSLHHAPIPTPANVTYNCTGHRVLVLDVSELQVTRYGSMVGLMRSPASLEDLHGHGGEFGQETDVAADVLFAGSIQRAYCQIVDFADAPVCFVDTSLEKTSVPLEIACLVPLFAQVAVLCKGIPPLSDVAQWSELVRVDGKLQHLVNQLGVLNTAIKNMSGMTQHGRSPVLSACCTKLSTAAMCDKIDLELKSVMRGAMAKMSGLASKTKIVESVELSTDLGDKSGTVYLDFTKSDDSKELFGHWATFSDTVQLRTDTLHVLDQQQHAGFKASACVYDDAIKPEIVFKVIGTMMGVQGAFRKLKSREDRPSLAASALSACASQGLLLPEKLAALLNHMAGVVPEVTTPAS